MITLLKIIAKLTGKTLVATLDYDGEVQYKLATKSPFGEYYIKRYGYPVQLNEDGTAAKCYIKQWKLVE